MPLAATILKVVLLAIALLTTVVIFSILGYAVFLNLQRNRRVRNCLFLATCVIAILIIWHMFS